MPTGHMTEMATSSYLGWLILLLLAYPFVLVAVQIIAYGEFDKKRYTKWVNIISGSAFIILLICHLQTEVTYGKELLDWVNATLN